MKTREIVRYVLSVLLGAGLIVFAYQPLVGHATMHIILMIVGVVMVIGGGWELV